MSDKYSTDGSNPAEVAAVAKLEAALEELMSVTHEDNVLLTGYILQAVGSSATDERDLLTYKGKEAQSGVVTQGLLQYLTANADMLTFGDDDE